MVASDVCCPSCWRLECRTEQHAAACCASMCDVLLVACMMVQATYSMCCTLYSTSAEEAIQYSHARAESGDLPLTPRCEWLSSHAAEDCSTGHDAVCVAVRLSASAPLRQCASWRAGWSSLQRCSLQWHGRLPFRATICSSACEGFCFLASRSVRRHKSACMHISIVT